MVVFVDEGIVERLVLVQSLEDSCVTVHHLDQVKWWEDPETMT